MRIQKIKKIYENMPSWMTAPFAELIRAQLIKNRTFLETWNLLEQWENMPEEQRILLRRQRMKEMLLHAQERCLYYRKLFADCGFQPESFASEEDLHKIPILTRELLKEHAAEIMAEDITDSYEVSTGGSTGLPLILQMEKKAIYREWAYVYHFWKKYGYRYETDRIATFRAVDLKQKMHQVNPLYREIRMNPYSLNKNTVAEYHRRIKAYGADFLYGYPSLIYNFCRLAEEAGLRLKGQYRGIFLISENLYAFQEEVIRRVLDCPIAMFYGHTERAAFAEKMNGGYIFHPLYGYMEIEPDGDIPVVTGLINGKMPLIRYALDDTFSRRKDGSWDIVGHRNSDCLIGKNGEQFRASMLDFHGEFTEKLGSFQLEQTAPGIVFLCIQIGTAEKDTAEKALTGCRNRLGDGFELSLKWVEQLQVTSRGKYRFLVQHIE